MKIFNQNIIYISIITLLLTACDKTPAKAKAAYANLQDYQNSHIRTTDKNPTPSKTQTLIINTKDSSSTLDPQDTDSGGDIKILDQIYERLVRVDPNNVNKLIPRLAESWTIAQDKLSITFKIKPNVKFHDGSILDAQTCKLSLKRLTGTYLTPKNNPLKTSFDFIKSIDAQDLTLTLHLTRPVPRIALRNLTIFSASIVSPKLLHATKDMSQEQRSIYLSEWASGTGPFYLQEYAPKDAKVSLRSFDQYHNGKPQIKAIVFQQQMDVNLQIESLKAGETQMLDDPPRALWKQLENTPEVCRMQKWWGLTICYLGLNTKHEKTSDINLRKAIRIAINRDQLQKYFYGSARHSYSLIPPTFADYDPNFKPGTDFENNEKKYEAAKALIHEAGAKGKKLTLYYPFDSRPYLANPEKIAIKISQQLNAIGLKVTTKGMPIGQLLSTLNKNQYEMTLLGWFTDNGDPDNFYIPLASGNPKTQTPSNSNAGRVFDPQIHQLLIEAQSITDTQKRIQAYRNIEREFQTKHLGYVPLLNSQRGYAFSKRLQNVEVNPFGQYRFYNATLSK